jgi:hypothetical protein
MLGTLIEATASIAAVISVWSYGNHSKHAPYIGLISQCFWWTFAIYFDMKFIMLLNAFMTFTHIRNIFKYKQLTKEK